MDNHPTIRKDLIEAWERYMNDTYTRNDLALVLDSIKDDEHIQEFREVFYRILDMAMKDMPPTPEERKEIYRKKFAQLLAEYESKKAKQTIHPPSRNNMVRFRKIWYAAAAVLLLGLLIPATYLYLNPKMEQRSVQYVELVTQRGEIKTIFLPDQTEVTLNAGSRIKYLADFTGDERSVELCGEALFNVISDPARPFTVKTENMNIKVVGTVFGVKEYADDLTASVSVASGKVEVSLADEKLMLEKNYLVKLDKATGNSEKTTIDASNYLSWTDGTLYFDETPIREVVNILNRHYPQTEIEMAEGKYNSLKINGRYNKIYQMENILKGITYTTGLKYKKTGVNKYVLYSEK